jgi:hypothetical protein
MQHQFSSMAVEEREVEGFMQRLCDDITFSNVARRPIAMHNSDATAGLCGGAFRFVSTTLALPRDLGTLAATLRELAGSVPGAKCFASRTLAREVTRVITQCHEDGRVQIAMGTCSGATKCGGTSLPCLGPVKMRAKKVRFAKFLYEPVCDRCGQVDRTCPIQSMHNDDGDGISVSAKAFLRDVADIDTEFCIMYAIQKTLTHYAVDIITFDDPEVRGADGTLAVQLFFVCDTAKH